MMRKLSLMIFCFVLVAEVSAYSKEEFLTFPKYSFGFNKPANWGVRSASQGWCSLGVLNYTGSNNFPVFISIKAAEYPGTDLSQCVENLVPAIKQSLIASLVKLDDGKETISSLGGFASKEVIFSGQGAVSAKTDIGETKDAITLSVDTTNVPVRIKLVIAINDGVVYILEYGGQEKEFKQYEKDFNSLVASFIVDKKLKQQADVSMAKYQQFLKVK